MSENIETPKNPEIEEANNTFQNFISLLRDVVIIILIAFFIRSYIGMPFQIHGSSMADSYSDGEYIFVNRISYLNFETDFNFFISQNNNNIAGGIAKIFKKIPLHIGHPERGDVIVLRPPVWIKKDFFLKRVIGLPGETIRIENGKVFIKKVGSENFIEIQENYLSALNKGNTEFWGDRQAHEFTIPENHYWAMGDNRIRSTDSRNCFNAERGCYEANSTHFLPREDIIGKVWASFGYFNIFEKDNFPKIWSLSWEVSPKFFNTPKNATYPELD